jgi:hypothetical protein
MQVAAALPSPVSQELPGAAQKVTNASTAGACRLIALSRASLMCAPWRAGRCSPSWRPEFGVCASPTRVRSASAHVGQLLHMRVFACARALLSPNGLYAVPMLAGP